MTPRSAPPPSPLCATSCATAASRRRRGSWRALRYRWFVVGTVCVGAFMGQVDSSIAQMLLPRLEVEFGARLSTVSWVAVAYLLAMAAFLPVFGRLADMVGRK